MLPLVPGELPVWSRAAAARQFKSAAPMASEVLFCSDVTVKSCQRLCLQLRALDRITNVPYITLRIQSKGGNVMDALLVVDTIKQLRTPVHTQVDGYAASAATLISIAGALGGRSMHRHSSMLIHEMSADIARGTPSEIEVAYTNVQESERSINEVYERHTRLRGEALDAELKCDLWLDAPTCLAYGLVDYVVDSKHQDTPYFTEGLLSRNTHVMGENH